MENKLNEKHPEDCNCGYESMTPEERENYKKTMANVRGVMIPMLENIGNVTSSDGEEISLLAMIICECFKLLAHTAQKEEDEEDRHLKADLVAGLLPVIHSEFEYAMETNAKYVK